MARRRKTEEQMDLLEEGGLKDEGGTVDPVSGNDVPPGSTQEEVRDDIPAQLSEGEFVFPADVTRYIGLENLMELRQKAKMGLQKMEDMGQMGNSEEAIMSDNGEFEDTIDKTIEALPMAMGGMVPTSAQPLGAQVLGPPAGNTMPGQQTPTQTMSAFQMQPPTAMNQTANPNLTMAQGGMVPTVEQEMMQKGRQAFARGGSVMPVEQEMMQKNRPGFAPGGLLRSNPLASSQITPVATQPATLPGFSSFVQQPAMQQVEGLQPTVESKEFIGPNGERVTIQFVNGQPATPVPDGYREMTAEEKEEAMKPKIEQPKVQQRDGDGRPEEPSTEPNFGFGSYRSMEEMTDIFSTVNEDLNNLKATQKTRKQTPFMAVELFNKVVNGIKEGYYTNQAVNQVRSGENLTNTPAGDYASWRQNMSKPMAAATLETENEAKAVSSGNRDIQGSSFASRGEADAVANSGWGSDAHFDAIDDQFSANTDQDGLGIEGTDEGDAGDTSGNTGSDIGPGESPTGDDTDGSPFSKGGAVKPRRKKGLGRLK